MTGSIVTKVQTDSFTCIVCEYKYTNNTDKVWGTLYHGQRYLVCKECVETHETEYCNQVIADKLVKPIS